MCEEKRVTVVETKSQAHIATAYIKSLYLPEDSIGMLCTHFSVSATRIV